MADYEKLQPFYYEGTPAAGEQERLLQGYEAERALPQRAGRRPLWRRAAHVVVAILALAALWVALTPVRFFIHRETMILHRTRLPSNMLHYEFPGDLDTFFVKQGCSSRGRFPNGNEISGKVFVTTSPHEEDVVVVEFDLSVSDPDMEEEIRFERKENGLVFYPDAPSFSHERVEINVHIRVPRRAKKYESLKVEVVHLDVEPDADFLGGVPVKVAELQTVAGDVRGPETEAAGKSAAGAGASGPDTLKLRTVSGEITGAFGLGERADFDTTSGEISVDLRPLEYKGGRKPDAALKTRTVSGNTYLRVSGDLKGRALKANHGTVSGYVCARYPGDYEGRLKLETTVGNIRVEGKGVKVIRKENGWVGKVWEAVKGEGESESSVGTVSGNIDVEVGQVS